MLAAGAYSGDTGIFDEGTGELLYVLQGQKGGITQVPEPAAACLSTPSQRMHAILNACLSSRNAVPCSASAGDLLVGP